MAANMMTTPKWYEHITHVIKSYVETFSEECRDGLSYIDERKGVPFAAMGYITSDVDAAAAHAYLFEHDLKKFKQYAHVHGKLIVLRSMDNLEPVPFFFPCDMLNISRLSFLMIMSDSPQLREFLVRNIDNIANDTEKFVDRYDLNRHMMYNTLLMVEGRQLDRLKERSLQVLAYPTPSKWLQKRVDDYRFFLAFAEQVEASIRNGCIRATHFISSDRKFIYDSGIDDEENLWKIDEFREAYPKTWWTIEQVIFNF